MNPKDLKIRIGKGEDAEAMGRLAKASGFTFEGFDIDWTDLGCGWVVAEIHGEIVGAVQVLPGRPIGRIECLMLSPILGFKCRVVAYRGLLSVAMQALKAGGSQLGAGVIPFEMSDYASFARKRGWSRVASGNCYMARLR